MAEIKVEKKEERSSWLPWLIGALALAAIIFFATRGDERDDGTADLSQDTAASASTYDTGTGAGAAGTATSATDPATGAGTTDTSAMGTTGATDASSGATITDVGMVASSSNRATLANRAVDLQSAEVVRVVSDRGFTVGSSGQELFVMLDDKLNEGSAESGVQIKPGQRVKLGGTLMEPPSAETKEERYRGLSKSEESELQAQDVYLHASQVAQAQ